MSAKELENKWVLITGATSGIGEAAAVQFAKAGASLILTGRRKNHLKNLSAHLGNTYGVEIAIHSFDIRKRSSCIELIENLAVPIDILVNNAGLAAGADPVYEADFEDWDQMIDTNIKGLLTMTRLVSAKMKERNAGHIINIGSVAGHEAYPGGVVYCATKHAVDAITKSTKMDLTGTDVRVSSVSPGLVDTEFSQVRYHGDQEKAINVYKNMTPLTADDIAEIILFIASRPSHVNILDTIVFPVHQSSATMVHRTDDEE